MSRFRFNLVLNFPKRKRGFSLRASGNGGGKAVLNWSGFDLNAVDPLGYWVYEWSVNDNMGDANTGTVTNPLETTVEIEIDDPGTQYFFRVSGYDSGDVLLVQSSIVGPRTILGYTDVAAFVAAIEAKGRTVSSTEREALYADKTNGLASNWYTKMYDRVLLGFASAGANAVRQKALTDITFVGSPTHAVGYVDFSGAKHALLWSPTNAYTSVNGIGIMYGLAADDLTNPNCVDCGVRTGVSTDACDLLVRGYGVAQVSFGGSTARFNTAVASVLKGFYLGHRTSATAGRIRYLLSGGSPTTITSSASLSGGGLNTAAMALAAYNLNGGAVDNHSNRRYSQFASFDGLTNTEADDALIDALALEIALGWRT